MKQTNMKIWTTTEIVKNNIGKGKIVKIEVKDEWVNISNKEQWLSLSDHEKEIAELKTENEKLNNQIKEKKLIMYTDEMSNLHDEIAELKAENEKLSELVEFEKGQPCPDCLRKGEIR